MNLQIDATRDPIAGPAFGRRARLYLAAMLSLASLLQPTGSVAEGLDLAVEVRGLDSELETNVRLFLGIEQQKNSPLLDTDSLRRLHRRASLDIAEALKPYGYYRPVIETDLVRETAGNWRAVYTVEAGDAIRIESVDFVLRGDAREDPEYQALIEADLPRSGDVFSHVAYENFKASLVTLASERGYFDASFSRQRVEIDLEVYRARVFLEYAGGPRYRFGAVELGQSGLEESLLRRFATFRRGDPYGLDQLVDFQRALNGSDYFQTVEVFPGTPDTASTEVPIIVRLVLRKPHRYDFGLGYGTDTRGRALFGWRMPRVNERGHRLNTRLSISGIGYNALARYRIPVLDPRTDELFYSASEEEEEFENGDNKLRTLGVGLKHSRGNWRETLSLEYQREEFPIDDNFDRSTLLIPGVSWTRTWGSNFINVLDGLRFDLSLQAADDDLVSDTTFGKLRSSLKFISSFGPRDRVLMRGVIGSIDAEDFDKIPSSIRFFAGGSNSVRGYAYHSLGPTDDDGDVAGGKYLVLGSVEFEHYFNDRWGMAVFYDVGNAIDDIDEDLESGAGFGVRWKSLIGPVRVDLANAISDDEDWRLHINIGPDL